MRVECLLVAERKPSPSPNPLRVRRKVQGLVGDFLPLHSKRILQRDGMLLNHSLGVLNDIICNHVSIAITIRCIEPDDMPSVGQEPVVAILQFLLNLAIAVLKIAVDFHVNAQAEKRAHDRNVCPIAELLITVTGLPLLIRVVISPRSERVEHVAFGRAVWWV